MGRSTVLEQTFLLFDKRVWTKHLVSSCVLVCTFFAGEGEVDITSFEIVSFQASPGDIGPSPGSNVLHHCLFGLLIYLINCCVAVDKLIQQTRMSWDCMNCLVTVHHSEIS